MAENGPFPFTDENIEKSPDQHGVYALYDGNEIIYFGRAMGQGISIRSRLRSHKSGNEGSCTKKATHYWREVCSNPVTREKDLLQTFLGQHGKLPRCNEKVA